MSLPFMGHMPAHHKQRMKDSRFYFAVCELPSLLLLALIGFMIEFIIELPFMMVCLFDHHLRQKRRPR